MSEPDEKIPVESPWAYMNRTAPLALDFGPDGVQTGDDEPEAPYGGLRVEPVRSAPQVHGKPVEMTPEQRDRTFRRDWSKMRGAVQREPYVPPVPTPPRVPCRDAWTNEMPGEVSRLMHALAPVQHTMMQLRATYAQAGDDRLLKQTGRCVACGTVATVNADGSLRSHSRPKPEFNCMGSGAAPAATSNGKGTCSVCSAVKALTKKGAMPAHKEPTVACAVDSSGEEEAGNAYVMLPPTTLPPIESLVLRAVWAKDEYAFGCYVFDNQANKGAGEWAFDYAIIRGAETNGATVSVGITAWRAFMGSRVALVEQATSQQAPEQMILEM